MIEDPARFVAPVLRGVAAWNGVGPVVRRSRTVPAAGAASQALTIPAPGSDASRDDYINTVVDTMAAADGGMPRAVVIDGVATLVLGESIDAAARAEEELAAGNQPSGGPLVGVDGTGPGGADAGSANHASAGTAIHAPAGNQSAGVHARRSNIMERRVCVVTGGAQGFGENIAREFARAGAYVVLADLNVDGAAKVCDELNSELGHTVALAVKVDVSSEKSVRDLINTVVDSLGGIDLFVSNAGVLKAKPIREFDVESFDFVTNVNYKGFFLCSKWAADPMALQNRGRKLAAQRVAAAGAGGATFESAAPAGSAAGQAGRTPSAADAAGSAAAPGTGGRRAMAGTAVAAGQPPNYFTDIIQINSKSGLEGSNKNAAYAGSKFGGIGLVQSFAKELIEESIKVNAICPGNFFDGPLWSDPEKGLFVQYLNTGKVPGAKTIEDVKRAYEEKVPFGRGCRAEDVVRAIYYVVEQEYETGQAVPVTGGQVMMR